MPKTPPKGRAPASKKTPPPSRKKAVRARPEEVQRLPADGGPAFPLEIDPLFALDERECAEKIPPGTAVTGPTALR